MPTIVHGDGPTPCRVMVVGERPGIEEARTGRPFVGPAGDELWSRLRRICKLERSDVFTVNLVRTFSTDAPTREEIARWSQDLRVDLYRCSPTYILTIGYHAARWFLPQYEDVNGDYFHGLPHHFTYGRTHVRRAIVIPCVHASAALRQPNRYQNQFTDDLTVAAHVLSGARSPRTPVDIHPYRVGLAGCRPGTRYGCDTEYSPTTRRVQSIQLSWGEQHEAALVAFPSTRATVVPTPLIDAIEQSGSLVCHMAKAEMHSLTRLGIDTTPLRIEDTMLKAYLLGLPQSLKVLAFRLLGWRMSEYEDLIAPVDAAVVRSTLEVAYGRWSDLHVQHAQALKGVARRHRRTGARAGKAKEFALARLGQWPREEEGPQTGHPIPSRALSSLKRFIHGTHPGTRERRDDQGGESGAPKETLRRRWQKSVFAPLVDLPPAPTWEDLPSQIAIPYALTDPIAARAIDDLLTPQLKKNGLQQIYEIDRAVLPLLVRNEQIGLACDATELRRLSKQFGEEYDRTCREIDRLAGHPVNPRAGEDVAECLFLELGVTPTRKTKSGKHFTTQDKYLKARKHEHAIIPLIISARQLGKYKSTYTDRLPLLLVRGRYHPDWRYTRTPSGRLAEEIILLIPKHDPTAKSEGRTNRATAIRNCFHATAGHTLVSVDLSQIELRTMAHLSRDPRLLNAYRRGEDIHAQVAHDLLGAPKKKTDQDESAHRLPAKTLNFGIINGMTEFGVLDQLHEAGQLQWTIDDVRELLKEWFVVHKGVAVYWAEQIALVKRQGYIVDLFGRRRYLAGVTSTSEQVRRESERQCLGAIQSTADGISKIWNKKIWKRIILPRQRDRQYCEPWVRVHDDTTLEVTTKHAAAVAADMLALVPQLLRVPTTAEAKSGVQWGDLH